MQVGLQIPETKRFPDGDRSRVALVNKVVKELARSVPRVMVVVRIFVLRVVGVMRMIADICGAMMSVVNPASW